MPIRQFQGIPAKIIALLVLILLLPTPVFAQDVLLSPPGPNNSQIVKASTGAPFNPGWNYFTVGVDGCSTLAVLNELQADGGAALNVDAIFVKNFFNWDSYTFESVNQKNLGANDLLAFNSNQKFFLQIDQKSCVNPDAARLKQVAKVRESATAKNNFLDKVSELPVDLWTKLTNLLNQDSVPATQSTNSGKQSLDNPIITGKTTVNDLGITGKVTAGLLTINGFNTSAGLGQAATLDTLSGDLYLQDQGLGGINILNGKITIDKSGNLTVSNTITAQKIQADILSLPKASGSSVLPANTASVDVKADVATQNSKILITPTTLTDKVLTVTQKINGGFTVSVKTVDSQDIHFDWFIVN